MKQNVFFVSGIDTNIGKTVATGFLARIWMQQGFSVITQKLIQTGNTGFSEDIAVHRQMMGTGVMPEDHQGLTSPQIFSYPASPHLAARLENRQVDFDRINHATSILSDRYDKVLVEGAGGLMVPLTDSLLQIDYIAAMDYPLIFVTGGRLGSINHTLLSLEAIEKRGIKLHLVLFNEYHDSKDNVISNETFEYIRKTAAERFPDALLMNVPETVL